MTVPLTLIGFASGIAANNPDCALGPWYLYYHPQWLQHLPMATTWQTIIKATSALSGTAVLDLVEANLNELSRAVLPLAHQQRPFCVIGGDHSCGIGTWSAVAHANRRQGDIGLIWVDAHMDCHTPATSITQNIHGMPIAHLLGKGEKTLCQILDAEPKLKPQNLCLVGLRSYEAAEEQLLTDLGVKVFYMEDVENRGLRAVMHEACEHVAAKTCGYGLSIDLDAFDPMDAPGVGYRVPGGIRGQMMLDVLQSLPHKERLLGLEIAEYNPLLDEDKKTAHLLVNLIQAMYGNI